MNQYLRFSTRISDTVKLRFLGKFMATALFLASVVVLRFQDETHSIFLGESFEDNLNAAQKADKLCYVKFYTDFCYPCDKADERLMNSSRLRKLLTENYIATKINGWGNDGKSDLLAQRFAINTYPTIVITDGEGNEVDRCYYQESESHWAQFLEKTNGLRTAPAITRVSDNRSGNAWNQQPEFGIIVQTDSDYMSSRETATRISRNWNKGVWIFPGRQKAFMTVIGPFASKSDAKTAKETVPLAKGGEIIRLDEKPVRYTP